MIPEDTTATWRRPKLAEVGPTSAPNENLKLKEVEQTAAPTLGAAMDRNMSKLLVGLRESSRIQNESSPCIGAPLTQERPA